MKLAEIKTRGRKPSSRPPIDFGSDGRSRLDIKSAAAPKCPPEADALLAQNPRAMLPPHSASDFGGDGQS
jgi:hypothetical protein